MSALVDSAEFLSLLVQSMGAALIGVLCLLLNRVVRSPALSAWTRGWLTLAGALIALMIEQGAAASAAATLPLYLFGEYLFGYWIIEGCARFGGRCWPGMWLPRLAIAAAVVSILLPQGLGYEFRAIFLVQSSVLAGIFASAALALKSPASARDSSGLTAMRASLWSLCAIFAAYVPIFGANVWFDRPLPMTLLKLSSAAHLVCEFLLGFGGAVLVLQHSHAGLAVQNETLRADNEKFREHAERDSLTGTLNRFAFFQYLQASTAAGRSLRGCVAMIDVDGLKQVNDNLGHACGDAAIIRVARAIERLMRRDDRLFRWGGDEFLWVTLDQSAAALGEQLAALNPHLAATGALPVEVSYGAADFGTAAQLADVVRHADAYMYEHKRERKRSSGRESMVPSRP